MKGQSTNERDPHNKQTAYHQTLILKMCQHNNVYWVDLLLSSFILEFIFSINHCEHCFLKHPLFIACCLSLLKQNKNNYSSADEYGRCFPNAYRLARLTCLFIEYMRIVATKSICEYELYLCVMLKQFLYFLDFLLFPGGQPNKFAVVHVKYRHEVVVRQM